MKISKVSIKNFRSIKEISFEAKDLSLFIGNNGTGKTSIIEAINFALSPYFLSGRIKHTDFYNGSDDSIIIRIEFDSVFTAKLPDGYTTQKVECNGVYLEIKKRDRAANGKAFSDIVVLSHHVIPNRAKDNEKGWEITRGTGTK
ncbi:MAG: AAA family ATPase, partial [Parcubacteria group bacterium]